MYPSVPVMMMRTCAKTDSRLFPPQDMELLPTGCCRCQRGVEREQDAYPPSISAQVRPAAARWRTHTQSHLASRLLAIHSLSLTAGIACVLVVCSQCQRSAASRVAFCRDINPRRRVCCTVRRGRCLRRRGHGAPSPRLKMGTGDLLRGVSSWCVPAPGSNSVLLPDRMRTHAHARMLSRPFSRRILAAAVAFAWRHAWFTHDSRDAAHRACAEFYALREMCGSTLSAQAAGLLARAPRVACACM